ncbi:hypothetical protein RJ639_034217 [Escallonia herrerae]|uniref:J domain-containing protein n=1 Tax=Escallonia herrerae TaxID=1293975 RepID=A0AA88X0N5_9ASTE|nr:hypothetical protein RJ639_034217 [Escallonia herrerae]
MEQNTSRAEAERLLGIAEKLLQNKDLNGSRDFAVLAQETEPLLDGSDQILAVVDVLLAAEKRINNNHLDWYGILQPDRRTDDLETVKKQYRRLALLLHPDKNKFPFADAVFKLVADSWAVLSNQTRKSSYDVEVNMFTKVDLVAMKKQKDLQNQQHDLFQQKLPVRRSSFAQPRQLLLLLRRTVAVGAERGRRSFGRRVRIVTICTSTLGISELDSSDVPFGGDENGSSTCGTSSGRRSYAEAPNGGVAGAAVAATPVQIVDRFANVSAGIATPPAAQTGPKKRGRPRKNPL